MKQIILFNSLKINISETDWQYLCNYRFFTTTPSDETVQAEFVSGTGITSRKKHLWKEADKRFAEYIEDLREINKKEIER